MKRRSLFSPVAWLGFSAAACLGVPVASAHIEVQPTEVGAGTHDQPFSVVVPNEKDGNPTVSVRLVLPGGLQDVVPQVKPGWDVRVEKAGEDVSEIEWTGGSIGSGLFDQFTFTAQAPAAATTLTWKAYETYRDGQTASWDQEGEAGEGEAGPASQTRVVDDLAEPASKQTSSGWPATAALLVSCAALAAALWKRKA